MPHVIRSGRADLERAWLALPAGPWRWGRAVARVEGRYLSSDRRGLLVAGVVVEYGRSLHPVVLVSLREDETAVHLWSPAAVERTDAVKRFVATIGAALGEFGCGPVAVTNLELPA